MREGERVDRELRERLVGPCVGLVIQDVDRAVPDLQEVDVSSDDAGCVVEARRKRHAPSSLDSGDVVLGEPYRDLDRDGDEIIRQHELLQLRVPLVVRANGGEEVARRSR